MTASGTTFAGNIAARHRASRLGLAAFAAATMLSIVALTALLASILNSSMGLVVYETAVPALELGGGVPPEKLSADRLAAVLRERLPERRLHALEVEGRLEARDRESLLRLVETEILRPRVVASYDAWPSLFGLGPILEREARSHPGARAAWRRWWTADFVTGEQSADPFRAGVRAAVLGSLWMILITIAVAFPVGIGAGVYLEEYASAGHPLTRAIRTNINNLAGVPSIIYGILGLAVFVRMLGPLTSGAVLGVTDPATANGRTVLSAGLTMALLILPVIIIATQEALRAVPPSLREASLGLGATRWQTVRHHVLPGAVPGILTGAILSVSRAMGETAPLVVVGAATFLTSDPTGPFDQFTVLPMQIYQWSSRPQPAYRDLAAAAIVVLLALLLLLNSVAIVMRNRYLTRS